MKNIGLIAILSFLVTDIILMPTHGAELHDSHANVRALGMGNAYISVVQDSEALFYNPAGLAKISGYYWKIMDLKAGVSGLTALDKLANMQTSNGFASAINELYGERLYIGGGAQTSVTTPFVSASLFYDANASFHVDSPSNPELTLNYMTDTGIVAGFGFHILPFFQMGLAIKSFTRTGVRKTYGLSDLGALDPAKFEADLNNSGTGLGLDVGFNFTIDTIITPTFSFAWKNVGVTTVTPDAGAAIPPPSDSEEMIIGASVLIDTPIVSVLPTFDFRYLNRTDVQLGKKINFGVELDFPLVDIRGGYSQGYYTAGATVSLGLLKFDVATWGVELGEAPGQLEDRRYMLQATIELGFDPGSGFSGGGSSNRKGGRGGSSGGRRLKQRR